MRKVFIVDPALRDYRGHHFQITQAISNVFISKGYEVIWVTNKGFDFKANHSLPFKVLPTFSEDTYSAYNVNVQKKDKVQVPTNVGMENPSYNFFKYFFNKLPYRIRKIFRPISDPILNKRINDEANKELIEINNAKISKPRLRPAQELYRALIDNMNDNGSDIVYFHTCDYNTYKMIAAFFTSSTTVNEWNKFPIFHLSTPYDENIMPHNKGKDFSVHLHRLKSFGLIGKRVFLYAENQLLSEHLSMTTKFKVQNLPAPVFNLSASNTTLHTEIKINIAYLGAARTEKGFCILPAVVKSILTERKDVKFTIQISPQIMGYTPDVKRAVEKLKSLNFSNLSLIHESQTPESYQQSMKQADIMLLCYDLDRYRVRGSGIAIEAIMNEVSIISTNGTFPQYISNDSGIGISCLTNSEISSAICQIIDNMNNYRILARDRKRQYMRENGVDAFINHFIDKGDLIPSPLAENFPRYIDSTPWKNLL